MKKVLVTGSAGFIGMHTALKLAEQGYQVVGLDNINDYYDINLKLARLKEQDIEIEQIRYNKIISGSKNIKFIKLELKDKENIIKLFKSESFDFVVHLAAQAGVRYSLENPDQYVESNVSGTLNILEACRQYTVKHLIFASSSSVYGLNKEQPFQESHPTEHPVSIYAATKKSAEMLAHSYAYLYKIPVTGLRFFTVYGPWVRPDMAIHKFTKSIIENKPIDVYNFGQMRRDFTYVDDIVEGMISLLSEAPEEDHRLDIEKLNSDTSIAPYAIFNIGAGRPVKLLDFISAIENKLGKKAVLNYKPLQPGDVLHTYADTLKLLGLTNYTANTGIEEGIGKFVEWYKNYYVEVKI